HVPSLGKTPRNITIDPTNTYLLTANQAGDNVVVFRIDHRTGQLTPTGSPQPVAQAAAVAFVKNPESLLARCVLTEPVRLRAASRVLTWPSVNITFTGVIFSQSNRCV